MSSAIEEQVGLLMPGYDAVALHADVHLGVTEQLFNLLAGRKLQEAFGQAPQVCITFPVLVRIDGELVESVNHMVLHSERVLQAGKRKFVRLVPPA